MTENNRRQAIVIDGGTPLANETGLAEESRFLTMTNIML